jgi:hypothetical protein
MFWLFCDILTAEDCCPVFSCQIPCQGNILCCGIKFYAIIYKILISYYTGYLDKIIAKIADYQIHKPRELPL